jgi:PrtD family type I secretion system ABC transporter
MAQYVCSAAALNASPHRGALGAAVRTCRWALITVGLLTSVINVLALSGSIFMLEVYNRVLPSQSLPTLGGLCVLVFLLLGCQGLLDLIRARLLVRIGTYLHERTREQVFRCLIALPVRMGPTGLTNQPIKDLDSLRSFLSSQGPAALFDLPWIPFYIGLLFLFHTYLGLIALAGGLVVVSLTLITEALSRHPLRAAGAGTHERDAFAEFSQRNGETILALGMNERMVRQWRMIDHQVSSYHRKASDISLGFSTASRTLRFMIQSAVLAVGAILVIQQQATGGIMVASAILAARALAPIDVAIAHWRGFVSARQSWRRLSIVLAAFPQGKELLALPAPKERFSIEHITVIPPGRQMPVLHDINFDLRAGDALGVAGPSASGKSSLARALVGSWAVAKGTVTLDGARFDQWSMDDLGAHIGYLAQHVELFPGTIADNICRFEPAPRADHILKAAQAADVHDLITSLPDGYQTCVGPGAAALSTGQQQRIALARALYREPFLVVLDEPNSCLDTAGEAALSQAILGIRKRGGIAVVVSHRQSVLVAVSHILVLGGGRIQKFGLRDDVLRPKPRVVAVAQPTRGRA